MHQLVARRCPAAASMGNAAPARLGVALYNVLNTSPPESDAVQRALAEVSRRGGGREAVTDALLWHRPGKWNETTPFHAACVRDASADGSIVAMLLPYLSPELINRCSDVTGATGLHLASSHNNVGATELLLAFGASVKTELAKGTPLHMAANNGNETVVRLLLEAGADPDASNREGHTPRDYAEVHGHDRIMSAIDEHYVRIRGALRAAAKFKGLLDRPSHPGELPAQGYAPAKTDVGAGDDIDDDDDYPGAGGASESKRSDAAMGESTTATAVQERAVLVAEEPRDNLPAFRAAMAADRRRDEHEGSVPTLIMPPRLHRKDRGARSTTDRVAALEEKASRLRGLQTTGADFSERVLRLEAAVKQAGWQVAQLRRDVKAKLDFEQRPEWRFYASPSRAAEPAPRTRWMV